ncbi:MAG: DUF2442 domain-containing protein [Chloroflexi bacterium]|nr:DUF2442 domain-containing protein [Chloroflexota bacterium]
MLEITEVEPLEGRSVRLTLSDGMVVVRDLGDLLDGAGVLARISSDEAAFRGVGVAYGTLVWPGGVDLAPETVIWDGPDPDDERRPEPFLRPGGPARNLASLRSRPGRRAEACGTRIRASSTDDRDPSDQSMSIRSWPAGHSPRMQSKKPSS